MSRQPFSRSSLMLWIFSGLIYSVKSGQIKNGELPARNGWQPLLSYDNIGNPSPPSNYAAYTVVSHFDSEREPSYKAPKQHRKSADTIHQYDYTPPSILGSFSIFGHSIPKNREGDNGKVRERESANTNEYDFLVPPPRQRIESYQKIKVNGEAYGGPSSSHHRDIYTPLHNQFTFISTGASSSSVVKKHPGAVPSRDELGHHHPLRQYPTAGESYITSQSKQPPWMQNVRDNIDPYHVNLLRHYPVQHSEGPESPGGNRFYSQIGHPPVFKVPYEVKNPGKPLVEKPNDYVTHHPPNLHAAQPDSAQQNEFTSFVPHFNGFDHNSVGKQHLEAPVDPHLHTGPAIDNYYNGRKKNTTSNWSISPSKNQFSELLPKFNKPVQFNGPNNAVPAKAVSISEAKLKPQIVPDKIAPSIPKVRQETPESISLKHFNEQQYLLQQQLLERDRQKLEQFQHHQKPVTSLDKHKERESSPAEPTPDKEFEVYEAVKLKAEKSSTPDDRQSSKRNNLNNYSPKQVEELPTRESLVFDYSPEPVTHKSPEADVPRGKKKKINHQRIVVNSEPTNYNRETIYNEKNYTDVQSEKIVKGFTDFASSTSSELLLETRPTFTTASGAITRTSPTTTTQSQGSVSSPADTGTLPLVTDITTRKSTTIKARPQSRGPTRRRRPPLETEPTPAVPTTVPSTSITTANTPEDYDYHRLIATPSYHSTEKSTAGDGFHEYTNEHEHSITEQESKGNTVLSEELITLVTLGHDEASEERIYSTSRSPSSVKDNYKESAQVSSTHKPTPETTTKIVERIRSTTRDYTSSIAPLEYLFNFTEKNINDEVGTKVSEWTSPGEKKVTSESTNSPESVESTTRSTYRLRPMKMTNNTRPRFSVKDYKSRFDYRNRLGQTSTTLSSPATTLASMKIKSMGKYKYTPRYSYPKTKSSTPSYVPKSINATDPVDGKRTKTPGYRPFTTANQRNKSNSSSTTEASEVENKLPTNAAGNDNKFVQPIRRRPHIKTSAQFAQLIKRKKNTTEVVESTPRESVVLMTEPIPTNSETFTETPVTVSTSTKPDRGRWKSNETAEDLPRLDEPMTTKIPENLSQQTSIQSDEEAFARASLSVADLTSSASALYNKPGMFKALSAVPVFDSDIHRKTLAPAMDEPSLPIEAFFRELSNKDN